MREILFRGKTKKGKWIEGDLCQSRLKSIFMISQYTEHGNRMTEVVNPETVGQYSGRTDKNNVKMFEGDIVTGLFLHSMPVNGVVAFRDGSFGLLWVRAVAVTFTPFTSMCNVEYEVIGNFFDNPELLEGGDEQ